MEIIHGADSFTLSNDLVTLYITREGEHVAPANFKLNDQVVSPYALAPWLPHEIAPDLPVLLKNLRGDFMCLPFGPQENGPPHGETANKEWELFSEEADSISLKIDAQDVGAQVVKTISLNPGETVIYYEHRISGMEGDFSYGNHPILDLSGVPEAAARLSTSPFRLASVYPEYFSHPNDGAQQALKIGALFSDLSEVPLDAGGHTDLTYYPSRSGNDDLVMMVAEDLSEQQPFAWAAVVFDSYVWFSLKNPSDFPATMFWLSNGGRSAAPWNSQHLARLGVEDICSHFCDSVDISRKDILHNLGVPTSRKFSKDEVVTLRNIQAVAAIPTDFGKVKSIVPHGNHEVMLTDCSGLSITAKVDWKRI